MPSQMMYELFLLSGVVFGTVFSIYFYFECQRSGWRRLLVLNLAIFIGFTLTSFIWMLWTVVPDYYFIISDFFQFIRRNILIVSTVISVPTFLIAIYFVFCFYNLGYDYSENRWRILRRFILIISILIISILLPLLVTESHTEKKPNDLLGVLDEQNEQILTLKKQLTLLEESFKRNGQISILKNNVIEIEERVGKIETGDLQLIKNLESKIYILQNKESISSQNAITSEKLEELKQLVENIDITPTTISNNSILDITQSLSLLIFSVVIIVGGSLFIYWAKNNIFKTIAGIVFISLGSLIALSGTLFKVDSGALIKIVYSPSYQTKRKDQTPVQSPSNTVFKDLIKKIEPFASVKKFDSGKDETQIENTDEIIENLLKKMNDDKSIQFILLIGVVDKNPLSPDLQKYFGNNMELAKSRARWVKAKIKDRFDKEKKAFPPIFILTSGPRNINLKDDAQKLENDRQVEIYIGAISKGTQF